MTAFMFFFFNDTATTEIYTLSLHDALPICDAPFAPGLQDNVLKLFHFREPAECAERDLRFLAAGYGLDRKSTRLNSSHSQISYAVFCLKKKKKIKLTARVDSGIRCSSAVHR